MSHFPNPDGLAVQGSGYHDRNINGGIRDDFILSSNLDKSNSKLLTYDIHHFSSQSALSDLPSFHNTKLIGPIPNGNLLRNLISSKEVTINRHNTNTNDNNDNSNGNGTLSASSSIAAIPSRNNSSSIIPSITESKIDRFSQAILQKPPENSRKPSSSSSSFPSSSTTIMPAVPPGKGWMMPINPSEKNGDMVIIHVHDEAKQVNKDFYCSRNLLVQKMKYFENFLSESENGYDDVDISVHCDSEIFEWLMNYIHEPNNPPTMDKNIVVSILISSEFLQIEELVDKCIEFFAVNLNDIIRLPIDLTCLSERLIHKLAVWTHPKVLATIKDKKDKIINKLYKRRVELDFSRKSSSNKFANTSYHLSNRSIASALTCCKHCGCIYLENCTHFLTCSSSSICIDFRGRLERRHEATVGWSLTSYLKALHLAGITWEAIYWHVWASCIVFRVADYMVSAWEINKYTVVDDGIIIRKMQMNAMLNSNVMIDNSDINLSQESNLNKVQKFRLQISTASLSNPSISITTTTTTTSTTLYTPTLNPMRRQDIITPEIHELLVSQMKLLSDPIILSVIEQVSKSNVRTSIQNGLLIDDSKFKPFDFSLAIYGEPSDRKEIKNKPVTRKRLPNLFIEETNKERSSSPNSQSISINGPDTTRDRSKSKSKIDISESSNTDTSESKPSRSKSAGKQRNKSMKSEGMGINTATDTNTIEKKGMKTTSLKKMSSIEFLGQISENIDLEFALRAIPSDTLRHFYSQGDVGESNIFDEKHPLQLHPKAYHEYVHKVYSLPNRSFSSSSSSSSSSHHGQDQPSDVKKLEWILDIIREYDEKRMESFERFLVSKRQNKEDDQSKINRDMKQVYHTRMKKRGIVVAAINANTNAISHGDITRFHRDYYRDKGRQPFIRPKES